MKNRITKYIDSLKEDIWHVPSKEYSRVRLFWIRQLKIILLALKKFDQINGQSQAASLTYYSVLSITPGLTLIYGLMKGFGLEGTLERELYRHLPGHESTVQTLFNMARSYIESTSGSIFAGIGVAILMYVVFRGLKTIENAFNAMWGIKEGKPFLRKLSDYLTVFLVCPLLLILSSSVTVVVTTQLGVITERIAHLGNFMWPIYILLHVLPLVVLWALFTFIYILMPNTQVKFTAALWGGIFAGTMYQIVQWTYIAFQVGIMRSNPMYGSLAAIPLFLIWLQASWIVMLLGAEVTFAKQNFKSYEFEPETIRPSHSLRQLAALLIAYVCVRNFKNGKKPQSAQQMAEHLLMPVRLAQDVLFDLVDANMLSKVQGPGEEVYYQPARTINQISVQHVLDIMDHQGQDDIPLRDCEEYRKMRDQFNRITEKVRMSTANVLLKDI